MNSGWLAVPRDWLASFGEIVQFCGRVVGEVLSLKAVSYTHLTLPTILLV